MSTIEELHFTDEATGARWRHDPNHGINMATQGVYALVRPFQDMQSALGYVVMTQPFVLDMYGGLYVAPLSGYWNSAILGYSSVGVLRLLARYELSTQALENRWVRPPVFIDVSPTSRVGFEVPPARVLAKVKHYAAMGLDREPAKDRRFREGR
jgi:hypothetical protein